MERLLGSIRTLGHMNPLSLQTKQYPLQLDNSSIYIHLIPLNHFILLIKSAYTHFGISEGMIIHLFNLYCHLFCVQGARETVTTTFKNSNSEFRKVENGDQNCMVNFFNMLYSGFGRKGKEGKTASIIIIIF